LIINDTAFLVASDRSLMLFSQERATSITVPVGDEIHDNFFRNGEGFFKLTSFHESLFTNLGAIVITLQIFMCNDGSDFFLLVGYDNGSVGVFSLGHEFLDSNGFALCKQSPFLVLVFPAHSPLPSSPFSPVALQYCPWSSVPGSVYLMEFYTIGNDFKVNHWGLRKERTDPTMDLLHQPVMHVDILGVRTVTETDLIFNRVSSSHSIPWSDPDTPNKIMFQPKSNFQFVLSLLSVSHHRRNFPVIAQTVH
jgi:hypothetical protein